MVVLQANKFFYEKGGSERYFFMLSDELERRGHRVVPFSMHHPDNRPSPYSDYFVSARDYGAQSSSRALWRNGASFIRSREAAESIARLVDDTGPDVAHLHNIYHQLTPSIITALRNKRVPVVMTLHDYKLLCPNYAMFANGRYCYRCQGGHFYEAARTRCNEGSFARSALLTLEAYVQRISRVYENVDVFLAPSRFMRDALVNAGFGSDRVRYLRSFLPRAASSKETSVGPDRLPESYILYFGRLSEEKGLSTLLDGARATPDVPVVICGDGPLRATLESRVHAGKMNNVTFTGHLNKAALEGVVARARAVVLPAEWPENAPFAVLEACAAGVPVIVSDMGGLPEMAEVVGGWIFPHGDAKALATLLADVWSSPALAVERGEAARVAVETHWGTDAHMTAIDAIYHELTHPRAVNQ